MKNCKEGRRALENFSRLDWRIATGCVLQISWLPLPLYLQTTEWSGLPDGSLCPIALFFVGTLAMAALSSRQSIRDENGPTFNAAAILFCIAETAAFMYGQQQGSALGAYCIALFCGGLVCGIGAVQWERCLLCLPRSKSTLVVFCYIAFTCLVAIAMSYLSAPVLLMAYIVCIVISNFARPSLAYPSPAPAASDSKLLRLRMASFNRRIRGSMAILGAASAIPIVLFASSDSSFIGNSTAIAHMIERWTPLALGLFAMLVVAGWLPKKEPDPFITFRASFVVALLSFFPLSPGTESNMQLVLVFSMVWAICIAGSIALITCEIDREYAKLGACFVGNTTFFVCIGALTGFLAILAIKQFIPQFSGISARNGEGTMLVCSISMACVMLIFIATNVLATKGMLHEVALFAQGKLAFHVPEKTPNPNKSGKVKTDKGAPNNDMPTEDPPRIGFIGRCKEIALEYGLTPRELEVLIILAQGNTLARVQEELVISEGTAITHRRNIYRKLDVHSKQELIDFVRSSRDKTASIENRLSD